jgi:NitT/TauT family transport system substrate-binding protein
LISIAAAIWITAGLAPAVEAAPLRIFYFIWVGYGPFFVAQEKGFFAKEGVEVELINVEDHTTAFSGGLYAGQVDAVTAVVQDAPGNSKRDEEPLACVLPLGDNIAGTGVVAAKDIHTVADLKGRSVAILHGSLQQFYLNVLLKEAGLSEADVEVVDLSAEDAARAFLLQEVDAAVTYDPFLADAAAAEHGHLLADVSQHPGLVVDCLMTTAGIFKRRSQEFKALARAWDTAVKYAAAHPAEANEIMARDLGLDSAALAEMLRDEALFDATASRDYLGTAERPGQIYQTMQYAIDIWTEQGLLDFKLTPADLIIHGIWDE